VAIDELIADRLKQIERVLAGRSVEVVLPPDVPLVDADYSQLDQVITNLLENTARHTPPGTTIRVEVQPSGSMMEVTVSDNGPGIAPEEGEAIFEAFHHGPGSSSAGVGLAVCRAIIDAHGGRIGLTGAVVGASVQFNIPLHA
jgi:two-component system sensor histidine kinase KdpD